MKLAKTLAVLLLAAVFGLGLGACEKKGPAERAGETIDESVEKAGDKAEEAGEKVGDATERAAEKVEETTDRK